MAENGKKMKNQQFGITNVGKYQNVSCVKF